MGELLKACHMAEKYHIEGWFAYKQQPPEWVNFCMKRDAMIATIQKESMPAPEGPAKKGRRS